MPYSGTMVSKVASGRCGAALNVVCGEKSHKGHARSTPNRILLSCGAEDHGKTYSLKTAWLNVCKPERYCPG